MKRLNARLESSQKEDMFARLAAQSIHPREIEHRTPIEMTARCLFEQLYPQLVNLGQIKTKPFYLPVIDPLSAGIEPAAQVDDHRIGVLCQECPYQPVELSHVQQEIGLFVRRPLDAGEVTIELADQFRCLGISYQCIGALALHRSKIQWYQERLGVYVQIADRVVV